MQALPDHMFPAGHGMQSLGLFEPATEKEPVVHALGQATVDPVAVP